jgi:Peptidase S24-like
MTKPDTNDSTNATPAHLSQFITIDRETIPLSLRRLLHDRADPAIVRISGNDMAPDYPDGSYVLVDSCIRVPSPDGEYVLAEGGSFSVRRCQMLPLNARFILDVSPTESVAMGPLAVRTVLVKGNGPDCQMQYVFLTDMDVRGMVVAAVDPETLEGMQHPNVALTLAAA